MSPDFYTAGFVGGAISTGSLKGAIRGGLFGALSAGLSFGVGHGGLDGGSIFGLGDIGTSIAHGVAQGTVNVLRGGKFGSGFLSGFAGKVAGIYTKGMDRLTQVTTSVIVGGTVSAMSGGKFANGAVTAAFVTMFNDWGNNKSLFKLKTRIGAVFQAHGGLGSGAGSLGVDITPGAREWDWSNDTSYTVGEVSLKYRIGNYGHEDGWYRQDSIKWGDLRPQEGVMSVSIGFIAGATVEFNYQQAWSNIVNNWNSSPLFPENHIGNWNK